MSEALEMCSSRWLCLVVLLVSGGCRGGGGVSGELVDMSHRYQTGETLSWPTSTHFTRRVVADGVPEGKDYYYLTADFTTSEHSGTHLDAPRHFYQDRWTTEQIPLDYLVNMPAMVIDISEKVHKDNSYLLSVSDLKAWDDGHGNLLSESDSKFVLLIDCGWAERWPNKTAYFGSDTTDSSTFVFPSISVEAAEWLNNTEMVGVGLDMPSIDASNSTTFQVHVLFGQSNIYALENIANVDQLPATGSRVSTLPMKIAGGSGAPARIFATFTRRDDDVNSVPPPQLANPSMLMLVTSACAILLMYLNI